MHSVPIGRTWHSRGQRFDPAYLHHKNRVFHPKHTVFSYFFGGFPFGARAVSNTFLTLGGITQSRTSCEGICNAVLSGGIQVGVDVVGHLDIRVSQPFLHILEGEAQWVMGYESFKQYKKVYGRLLFECVLSADLRHSGATFIDLCLSG